jgi:hypothetical protein
VANRLSARFCKDFQSQIAGYRPEALVVRLTAPPPLLSALVISAGFAEADLKVPMDRVVMAYCSANRP